MAGNDERRSVFLIEDEVMLRELFEDYLSLFPDLKFLGWADNGTDAVERCTELQPDLIVQDVRLPGENGLEIFGRLRACTPGTRILVFSGSLSEQTIREAKEVGADGFVEKSLGLEELRRAMEAVLRGETYYTAGAAEIIKRLP